MCINVSFRWGARWCGGWACDYFRENEDLWGFLEARGGISGGDAWGWAGMRETQGVRKVQRPKSEVQGWGEVQADKETGLLGKLRDGKVREAGLEEGEVDQV